MCKNNDDENNKRLLKSPSKEKCTPKSAGAIGKPLLAPQSEIFLLDSKIVTWNRKLMLHLPGALRSPLDPSHALLSTLICFEIKNNLGQNLSLRPITSKPLVVLLPKHLPKVFFFIFPKNTRKTPRRNSSREKGSGDDLLSRAVSSQVPSALRSLTSVFGMGTGVTFSSLPPEIVNLFGFHAP